MSLPKAISVSEASEKTGLAQCSIYQLIKDNCIDHFRIGRKHYATVESLEEYMTGCKRHVVKSSVNDVSVIVEQMEKNRNIAMELLSLLNNCVTDDKSCYQAIQILDNYYKAGVISRRLRYHMAEELSCVYQPEKRTEPEEGLHYYQTCEGIEKYINGTNQWVLKKILLWCAYTLENTGNLDTVTHTIRAHLHEGDIPENIATLAIIWLENIYTGNAEDFHMAGKEYGYET